MTPQEHLQKIKNKCEQLLAIAAKRTPGRWWEDHPSVFSDGNSFIYTDENTPKPDSTFIASCAGPAEAGWRATIAAIDSALHYKERFQGTGDHCGQECARGSIESIIATWPEELL